MRFSKQQFLDGLVQFPTRFHFVEERTGATAFTCDLEFLPGRVEEAGTPVNRGYFQRIEDFLGDLDFDALNRRYRETGAIVSALEHRTATLQGELFQYAPKSGGTFAGASVASPIASSDNSGLVATTRFTRELIAQYHFPPKNMRRLSAAPGELSLSVKWSDPINFVYDEAVLSEWAGTKVVYRTDRYPANPEDGVLLVDSVWRDYYSDTAYQLSKANARLTYYIQAFPYSKKGVYNVWAGNRVSVKPDSKVKKVMLPSLNMARGMLASGRDGSGNSVIGGGYIYDSVMGGGDVNIVERYNLSGGKQLLTPLAWNRSSPGAGSSGNGEVYFFGGYYGSVLINAVEKYTASGVKITGDPMLYAKSSPAVASFSDGDILVIGGHGENDVAGITVERYFKNGGKTTMRSLDVNRSVGPTAASDSRGGVVIGGGGSRVVERYLPDGTKMILQPLANARTGVGTASDGDGNVIFGCGRLNGKFENIVERYAPDGTKTILPPFSTARGSYRTATGADGAAWFIGGNQDTGTSAAVDRYYKNGTHSTAEDLSSPRVNHAVCSDGNGNIIVAGGFDGAGYVSTVEKYECIYEE